MRFLFCFSVYWCSLLLYETLYTLRLLKLDFIRLLLILFFLRLFLSFTFQKWRTSLEVFEGSSMKSKVFFLLWRERRLFSSLGLTSQCFSVSSIEGMFGFTSFLYSISWFPVHVEAHAWSVWEPFGCWWVSNSFSHSESAAYNPVSWKTQQQ